MIIARGLNIEAGARRLISDVDLTVQSGDKIGLVGRNGAGKTTLMRTLADRSMPEAGTITRSGVVGYLSQDAHLPELAEGEVTALERVLTARDIGSLRSQMEEVRLKMETAEGGSLDKLIARFSRLDTEFQSRGGYVAEAEAKRFAASLGISSDELDQGLATMSGGQRRRVELARILFAETDVLLLDEPTNHLDLDAKAWLMAFLGNYRGGLLVISHDLPLLDESITSVLALEGGRVEMFRGNYSYYISERDRRREQRIKERKHQDATIARLEEGIRRFKGSTEKMAKRARSWETRVAKLKAKRTEVGPSERKVAMHFPQPRPSGKTPLLANGLSKAFDDNVVFVDVRVDVDRGERLLIMGLNGAGKTTLLKILAGNETADTGEVSIGHNASLGYYAQEHEEIRSGTSVLDHMRKVSPLPDKELRSILGHFLLADKIEQDAGTLSGGEKTKLALAQIVTGGHNVLLLDEPTNNLDPQARDALLDAIALYAGTLILVSHDREFVEEMVPDRVVLMPDGETAFYDESLLDLVVLT
ncbi:MAG: ABC-F family ATP-binding cassette domain-containing protein [Acidimicrobiia bacterium]|nr:ABC-F family ATP-binding cassette domain-containing protein [Acidimicrobiia bacterium]